MEINIGMSECKKYVDNYNGRNFKSHAAPAERLSTVSSPFMVTYKFQLKTTNVYSLWYFITYYTSDQPNGTQQNKSIKVMFPEPKPNKTKHIKST